MVRRIEDLHGFPDYVNYRGHRFEFRHQGASSKKVHAKELVAYIKRLGHSAIIRVFLIGDEPWYAVYWRKKGK